MIDGAEAAYPNGKHIGTMNLHYFYINPDDAPAPPPPGPADRFHCDAKTKVCAAASSGHSTMAKCQEACGDSPAPPAVTYKCVDSECVESPTGAPLATCQLAC